jgi:hypothetical protein
MAAVSGLALEAERALVEDPRRVEVRDRDGGTDLQLGKTHFRTSSAALTRSPLRRSAPSRPSRTGSAIGSRRAITTPPLRRPPPPPRRASSRPGTRGVCRWRIPMTLATRARSSSRRRCTGSPRMSGPRSPPAPGSSWLHPTEVDSRQIPSHSNGSRDAQPGRITAWEPSRRLVQDRRDFRDCHARAVRAFGQTGGAHDQGFAALTSALGLATAAEGAELATGAASRRPSPARSTACARALAPRRASAHRRAGRRLCGAVGLRRGAVGSECRPSFRRGAAAVAAREQPRWEAWMREHFLTRDGS